MMKIQMVGLPTRRQQVEQLESNSTLVAGYLATSGNTWPVDVIVGEAL